MEYFSKAVPYPFYIVLSECKSECINFSNLELTLKVTKKCINTLCNLAVL